MEQNDSNEVDMEARNTPPSKDSLRIAKDRGWVAWNEGKHKSDNPYNHPDLQAAWLKGWEDAATNGGWE